MNLNTILTCEFASMDAGNSLSVLRTFNSVNTSHVPVRIEYMALVAIVHAHHSEAGTTHNFELVLLDQNRKKIADVGQGEFVLSGTPIPGLPISYHLVARFVNAVFPTFGAYAFELFVDGIYAGATTFAVVKD